MFLKKAAPTPPIHLASSVKFPSQKKSPELKSPPPGLVTHTGISIQREADRVALNRYVPASVLINTNLEVLSFRGGTSPYLMPPTGRATFNLLHMAKEGLLPSLRGLLTRAIKQHSSGRTDGIEWSERGRTSRTSIEVMPLANVKERCYLVFLKNLPTARPAGLSSNKHRMTAP